MIKTIKQIKRSKGNYMKFNIKNSLRALIFVPVLAFAVSAAVGPVTSAVTYSARDGADSAQGDDQTITNFDGTDGLFKKVTNILLYIIGAVSVIMIVYGGVRYVISGGESGAVTNAKNTILYAVVGLIIALLAYAIINFVLNSL